MRKMVRRPYDEFNFTMVVIASADLDHLFWFARLSSSAQSHDVFGENDESHFDEGRTPG